MKYTVFFYLVLTLLVVNIEQIQSLQVDTMDTYKTRIDVQDPSWGSLSSGILLSSNRGFPYASNRNKTLILSARNGYGLFAAFKLLNLRPRRQDSVSLFVVGDTSHRYTYSNTKYSMDRLSYPNEDIITFYAPNGQMGVTFTTGPSSVTRGYDGFELIYTVQADWTKCRSGNFYCNNGKCIARILTCDGHNHCGDRSDQQDCYVFHPSSGINVGIVCGVVFIVIAIACGIFIAFRRSRSRREVQTIINHPPPTTNVPSYPQPGTYYPPPPPPYAPYGQGTTNPGYH